MDDLGEGFSSLRLWPELRPEFVKIDMHFVQGINHDPVKLQFVRSIQVIAESLGTRVIAEGIGNPGGTEGHPRPRTGIRPGISNRPTQAGPAPDDMIQLLAAILRETSEPEKDLAGHIGGDDFVVLFQSEDWEWRCRQILQRFGTAVQDMFDADDKARNGFLAESRQGEALFFRSPAFPLAPSPLPGVNTNHTTISLPPLPKRKNRPNAAAAIHYSLSIVNRQLRPTPHQQVIIL